MALTHPLHAARKSAFFRGLVRKLDIPLFRQVEGIAFPICMRLGPNARMWLSGRPAEVVELDLFDRLIDATDGTQFVDVGANIGLYSFRFISRQPRGRAIALEPDPANVGCLLRTIRRRKLSGVEVRPVAASDHKGSAVFQFDDVAGVTGQLKSGTDTFGQRHYGAQPREGSVEVDTLDSMLGDDSRPDIIKIDVEGAETSVLRGACRILRQARPALLIELGEDRASSTELLKQESYTLVDTNGLGPLRPETWNALALPTERAADILGTLSTHR